MAGAGVVKKAWAWRGWQVGACLVLLSLPALADPPKRPMPDTVIELGMEPVHQRVMEMARLAGARVAEAYERSPESLPEGASGWRTLWKGVGVFLMIWGVLVLLGGFAGNRDVFSPMPLSTQIAGMTPSASAPAEEHLFVRVSSLGDLENRLAAAKTAGKPVILDYYADWCVDCLRMEKATFADPRVSEELRRRFVTLQVDVTDPNHPDGKAIKQRFGVYGPPAMLFFSADGQERRELRTYGFRNVEEFFALLRQV